MTAVRAAAFLLLPALFLAGPESRSEPERGAPAEFVSLEQVAPSVRTDIRYATAHNFTGAPVDGYREPRCLLTRDTAEALRRAQSVVLARGHTLKVYDCYRPQRAVDRFVAWASDPADRRTKAEFYPRVDKSRLIADGYLAERSGHSRGSTVDVTLVRLGPGGTPPGHPLLPSARTPGPPPPAPGDGVARGAAVPCHAPQAHRRPDSSVDMGTAYDCFDPLSHTLSPQVGAAQRANRLLLKGVLEAVGLVNLPQEWWHYTLRREPFPDTYFDFPVARSSLVADRGPQAGESGAARAR